MANLIITNACNLSCPFCFASEYLADGDAVGAERMTVDEVAEQLAFIGDGPARFCGGEPTTHPDFTAMVDLALATSSRQVFVMTNGVWSQPVRKHMANLPTSQLVRVRYLVNVLEPDFYTDAQWTQLLATLAELPPLAVTVGITLYKAPMRWQHMLDVAKTFGIKRLRFSVASPNTTDPRTWHIEPARDFPVLAPLVHQLVMDGRAAGLLVHSDCGYIPPCFFTPQQIEDLRGDTGHPPAMEFSCTGPVDIGPGGQAWRCYGLYNVVRSNTADFDNERQLGEDFEERTRALGNHFMFDACGTCDYRAKGQCMGGCFAYRETRSMLQSAQAGLVQIGEDRTLMDAVPQLNHALVHGLERRSGMAWMMKRDGAWVPLTSSEVDKAILGACDGTNTVRAVVARVQHAGLLKQPAPAVARAIRRLYQQGAITLSGPALSGSI